MTLWPVMLVTMLASPAVASPRSSISVEIGPGLPCTEAELRQAIGLRVELGEGSPVLSVASAGLDTVELRFEGQRRLLPLYGARGPAAARRVALWVGELVEGELAVELPPIPTATSALPAPKPLTVLVPVEPPTLPPTRRWSGAAWLGGGAGSNLDRPSLTLGVAGQLQLLGPLGLAGDAAFLWTPPGEAEGLPVTLWGVALRAGAQLDLGLVELRALGVLLPHRVGGGSDAVPIGAWGWVGGLGLQVERRWDWPEPLQLVLLLGLDLALNRRAYAVDGVEALATERALLWLAVGLGFGGAS